ncbi:HAD-like protein [Tilletiaria anomala UBC 951]|uniref:HAD-like protein n=1 Tax=Tilletiaria anomala (strain ATCC 24038 / CBS 436.72 / UBC 951) TaxID=1037660 RepID=A0A066W554_TILAU|nr:HAD-like protein [Tilletiaria anomala UBC 951]KDN45880.1 HAD-like protein [Tilletiaria anomala UBC 951]
MATELEVDAVLFDMDGTLIDSTPAVNQTWKEWIDKYNLDFDYVMSRAHGCRTVENLRNLVGLSEDQLADGTKAFEGRIAELAAEAKQTNGPGQIISLPGARELLAQINAGREKDPERRAGWAIVTSATKAYASKGFAASGVASAPPEVFVTADIVSKGKPDPEPYLRGAELTGSNPKRCIVVEDAPPGVVSGKRAGAHVIGLRTTHDGAKQWANGADFVVEDLRKVSARWEGGGKDAKLFIRVESEPKPHHVLSNGTVNGKAH